MPATIAMGQLPLADRRWLARGNLRYGRPQPAAAERVLTALDLSGEVTACAALRYFGQTGRWPQQPVAAADPVHFEAALDHLRAFAVDAADVIDELFADLNARLGQEGVLRFECHDDLGYVFCPALERAADRPVAAVHGAEPDRFMPEGASAGGFHRLMSEIQMTLHDAAANQRRVDAGRRPVNALWIWGIGDRAEKPARRLPALYADDPLITGLWRHAGHSPKLLPPALADCDLRAAAIVVGEPGGGRDAGLIAEARLLQQRRELGEVELRFGDGSVVVVRPWHRLRVWRQPLPAVAAAAEAGP
ncbi:MAG: hypothetical protein R3315_08005 [Woeseiaceae bacterium]|nr:hypothetical protein [Woeseiaceae bacterium]